jgi:hypothetical protein
MILRDTDIQAALRHRRARMDGPRARLAHPQFLLNPARFGAGAAGDPLFPYVVYLTNSGDPTDLSTAGTSIANTNVTSDSTAPAFAGGSSLLFNGTNAKLSLTGAAAKIATGDWAIRLWVYQTARTSGVLQFIWSQYDSGGGGDFANRSVLYVEGTNGYLGFLRGSDSVQGTTTLPLNTWQIVEVGKSGSTVYLFLHGASQGTIGSFAGTLGNFTPVLGHCVNNPPAGSPVFWTGKMSPIEITVGAARNTSGYTPPTTPFATS